MIYVGVETTLFCFYLVELDAVLRIKNRLMMWTHYEPLAFHFAFRGMSVSSGGERQTERRDLKTRNKPRCCVAVKRSVCGCQNVPSQLPAANCSPLLSSSWPLPNMYNEHKNDCVCVQFYTLLYSTLHLALVKSSVELRLCSTEAGGCHLILDQEPWMLSCPPVTNDHMRVESSGIIMFWLFCSLVFLLEGRGGGGFTNKKPNM